MTEGAAREHRYELLVVWTGNRGEGTASFRGYSRDHEVHAEGRPPLPGSSDPAFRGDPSRYNPEQLLVASLSQCHMLWYLHLCSTSGVVVTDYRDAAEGVMAEERGGSGRFVEVVLRPRVTVERPEMVELAERLHGDASRMCFIANSMAFPVRHEPVVTAEPARL